MSAGGSSTADAGSPAARRSLVADADAVVHLAFIIMGSREQAARTNLAGSRDVFEAIAAAPRVGRLVYNLAGDGDVSFSDILDAVGAHGVRVPQSLAVAASQVLRRVPALPSMAEWVHAGRASVVMDTGKANRELRWRPRHTAEQALAAMARQAPGAGELLVDCHRPSSPIRVVVAAPGRALTFTE